MQITRRTALAAGLASLAAPALAQPGDPLRIIAAFPPGAALDGIARLLAEAAPRHGLGNAIVDNRPGANGNIAAAITARAEPNGRTLLLAIDSSFTVNPFVYGNLGFDPAALRPVAVAGTYPVVLLVHPTSGIGTLAEFLAAARRQPLLYASAGYGSPGHLAMEHLGHSLGLRPGQLEHVPFRGNAQAVTELLAGRVQAGFIAISGGADFVKDGRLRALAISGPQRIAMLPDVATVAEQGHAGFDIRFAYLLMAPRAIPEPARAAAARLVAAVFADPAARARLANWAVTPEAGDGAAAEAWVARASTRWREVVQATGMKVD
ncbi:Bug family tripartite tricarboxylate transporter substrate binding protein [Falsiroseomonas selenitidurans]|uniref:Tripartite tricarboxylate transporter substrate binding protein n=1 Tax=Falsiroseomonas selenitidurans TaxID=2716335 RepID=A0ABX1E7G9_9PROT|nr:tripartite tricarboxylate transporter substrate binding protein [Falsiroseomonas selenitidurans]NKC33137.1 tripartite tricarboxylate transporter substrate binding protein [Falsiroseomonas selenitidurans]